MTDLTWSSESLLKEFPSCRNLQDVVQLIENRSWIQGEVVFEIRVNGQILDDKKESSWAHTPIEEIMVLHVQSTRPEVLAFEALSSLQNAIPEIVKNSDELAKKFRNIEGFSAAQLLPFLDSLSEFTQAMTFLRPHLQSWSKVESELTAWVKIEEGFAQIMKDLIRAFEVADQSLIADLLEYDLANALEEWRRLIGKIQQIVEGLRNSCR